MFLDILTNAITAAELADRDYAAAVNVIAGDQAAVDAAAKKLNDSTAVLTADVATGDQKRTELVGKLTDLVTAVQSEIDALQIVAEIGATKTAA